jgi:hypothetical protein
MPTRAAKPLAPRPTIKATHKWWFELDEDKDGRLIVPMELNKQHSQEKM